MQHANGRFERFQAVYTGSSDVCTPPSFRPASIPHNPLIPERTVMPCTTPKPDDGVRLEPLPLPTSTLTSTLSSLLIYSDTHAEPRKRLPRMPDHLRPRRSNRELAPLHAPLLVHVPNHARPRALARRPLAHHRARGRQGVRTLRRVHDDDLALSRYVTVSALSLVPCPLSQVCVFSSLTRIACAQVNARSTKASATGSSAPAKPQASLHQSARSPRSRQASFHLRPRPLPPSCPRPRQLMLHLPAGALRMPSFPFIPTQPPYLPPTSVPIRMEQQRTTGWDPTVLPSRSGSPCNRNRSYSLTSCLRSGSPHKGSHCPSHWCILVCIVRVQASSVLSCIIIIEDWISCSSARDDAQLTMTPPWGLGSGQRRCGCVSILLGIVCWLQPHPTGNTSTLVSKTTRSGEIHHDRRGLQASLH